VKSRFIVEALDRTDKGTDKNPLTIGRELGVSNVIVGDLRMDGEKFSVEVELLDVENGSIIWRDNIPGKFGDIMSVPGEVAEKVVTELNLELSAEEKKVLQKRLTENSEAFRKYTIGRGYFAKRTRKDKEEAIKYFNEAIDLDPKFAHAYSGLADAYQTLDGEKAREAALEALRLDNSLAEAHASLALVLLEEDWNWEGAEEEFKAALTLNPNYANAHHWYGRLLTILGRHDDAIKEMELARELDPIDMSINRNLGMTYLYAGQVDEAIEQLLAALEMDPDFPLIKDLLVQAYLLQSMFKEVLELYDYDEEEEYVQIGRLLGLAKENKESAVAAFAEDSDKDDGVLAAFVYAQLGETDKVFEYLERAYEVRFWSLIFVKAYPFFLEYHSDPRFQALLKKMGLD
jgi:Tfp pilus assembly protein PilF